MLPVPSLLQGIGRRMSVAAANRISVVAPARLHMGFLDLNGSLGRQFGSMGATLEEIVTRVHISAAEQNCVTGTEVDRAAAYVEIMCRRIGLTTPVHVDIESAIPAHNGLGSGTQLALAIGMGLQCFSDGGLKAAAGINNFRNCEHVSQKARDVATWLGRGKRSAIGIGAFESGGFILDGGKSSSVTPPPVTLRHQIPAQWRFLLVFDHAHTGASGEQEVNAFHKLSRFPDQTAGALCRLVIMQLLPALAEHDIDNFGSAITEIQCSVGDHFAEVQGGRFSSPGVSAVLEWMQSKGVRGIGQSSWGPTGFAVLPDQATAESLVQACAEDLQPNANIELRVCQPRNVGATITATTATDERSGS